MFENLTGGKRPTVEGDVIRCGDCREVIQPDAGRCPHCLCGVYTLKGRGISRSSIILGLIISSVVPGALGLLLGILLIVVGVYYIWQAPIYSLKPPHRPDRPEFQ